MKKLPESSIEHAILETLAGLGIGFFWKNVSGGFFDGQKMRRHASPFAINGTSDILGVLSGGRMVAIEVKTATGRLSDKQEAFLRRVGALGAVCGVARSPEEALRLLRAHGVDV